MRIAVVGHFGFGKQLVNGQTIKTKILAEALQARFGADAVSLIDSSAGLKAVPKLALDIFRAFCRCDNIIMLPAHNGVKFFAPLFAIYNFFFRRGTHYVVIGGWLPEYLDKYKWLRVFLRAFSAIYVETNTACQALTDRGLSNAIVMPNFKRLAILREDELCHNSQFPLRLCTFSTVMREKGIEDAIDAVTAVNERSGFAAYSLDIYGPIYEDYRADFNARMRGAPSYIEYKGVVAASESVDVLKNYYALVFPTRFFTEGVPGTIIDAYASGLPVICSRWASYADIVDEGVTGAAYDFEDIDALIALLEHFKASPHVLDLMKVNCLDRARAYMPEQAIDCLISRMVKL